MGQRTTLPYSEMATASTGRVQDKFPAYENFPWEAIKSYLDKKFPGWTEYKESRIGDQWHFEIPELLKDSDHAALRKLRDERKRQQRSSVTPGG